jgi:hypothetical protein
VAALLDAQRSEMAPVRARRTVQDIVGGACSGRHRPVLLFLWIGGVGAVLLTLHLVASEGLNPGAPGARIAVANGKRAVVDGPFAESKELVGGIYLIDVASFDEAIQWALRAPSGFGADDILDVRQLTGPGDLPPDILRLIKEAAPTWSAAVWQARETNRSK